MQDDAPEPPDLLINRWIFIEKWENVQIESFLLRNHHVYVNVEYNRRCCSVVFDNFSKKRHASSKL